MQLILFLGQVKIHTAADTFHAPCAPLAEYLPHAHDLGVAGDKDVEVAGEAVHKRGEPEQLLHELFGVGTALEIDGELKTAEVGLVSHIVYLTHLAGLNKLCDLVNDGFGRGGIGYLVNLDDVFLLDIAPAGSDLEAATAGVIDVLHLRTVVDYLTAGGEIGCRHGREQVALGV